MKRAVFALGLALAGCARVATPAEPAPADFALALAVTPAPGAPLQQIELPAAALLAMRRADHGDIRIFDAHDRPLALALLDPPAPARAERHFAAMPVAKAAKGASTNRVHLETRGQSISLDAEQGVDAAADAAVLIDTRDLADPALALRLDASLPPAQPVSFAAASSPDLTSWTPLAEQVLFRPDGSTGLLGDGQIALPAAQLHHRYLKVSWKAQSGVAVTGATLVTSPAPPPRGMTIATTGLKLAEPHQASFALPPALTPAALRIAMTGADGVVPLQLLGRDSAEAAWAPLAMVSLRQGGSGAEIELGPQAPHQFRLQADPRGAGFSSAPTLQLELAPIHLLVAFNGVAPYRLAAGSADARPKFFSAQELGATAEPAARAKVAAPEAPALDLAATAGAGSDWRRTALWAILLAAVAVLGLAAYRLLAANAPKPADGGA